jgi:hypothetical protein
MSITLWKRSQFSCLFIVALFGCCAVLTWSSCSKKPSAAIIGKWEVQDDKEIVEFHADGTLTSSGSGDNDNGTYTFTDDSHMKVAINDTNEPIVLNCTVHIQGDAMDMTMTLPGENKPTTSHLKRIK